MNTSPSHHPLIKRIQFTCLENQLKNLLFRDLSALTIISHCHILPKNANSNINKFHHIPHISSSKPVLTSHCILLKPRTHQRCFYTLLSNTIASQSPTAQKIIVSTVSAGGLLFFAIIKRRRSHSVSCPRSLVRCPPTQVMITLFFYLHRM